MRLPCGLHVSWLSWCWDPPVLLAFFSHQSLRPETMSLSAASELRRAPLFSASCDCLSSKANLAPSCGREGAQRHAPGLGLCIMHAYMLLKEEERAEEAREQRPRSIAREREQGGTEQLTTKGSSVAAGSIVTRPLDTRALQARIAAARARWLLGLVVRHSRIRALEASAMNLEQDTALRGSMHLALRARAAQACATRSSPRSDGARGAAAAHRATAAAALQPSHQHQMREEPASASASPSPLCMGPPPTRSPMHAAATFALAAAVLLGPSCPSVQAAAETPYSLQSKIEYGVTARG